MTTLEDVLKSRDNRRAMQQKLLSAYKANTLVCLTVVVPGPKKRTDDSLTVAHAAARMLRTAFDDTTIYIEECDLQTGYELYLVTTLSIVEAKHKACDIEDHHPLGRLMDIDIIQPGGVPVPRAAVGREERRCLLCRNTARYCMRQRTHTQEELAEHIHTMVEDYRKSHPREEITATER